jgi:hypothetical protein
MCVKYINNKYQWNVIISMKMYNQWKNVNVMAQCRNNNVNNVSMK